MEERKEGRKEERRYWQWQCLQAGRGAAVLE